MKAWIAFGLLLMGFAGNARAAEISPEKIASVEYYLAAAAQPGTPASDWVLAHTVEIFLSYPDETETTGLPPELKLRLAAERDRLLASANRALMDDPVQLSVRLNECAKGSHEESECRARRVRLAELDGDNAATAVALMGAAWIAQDSAGFLEAAARGAKASRHEPAFLLAFGQLRERFAAVPDVAVPGVPLGIEGMERADMAAMNLAAASALSAHQNFSQPCREAEGELLDHCLAIARMLMRSESTFIDVAIGASLLSSHGTVQDQAEASKRGRESYWLMTQVSEVQFAVIGARVPGQDVFFDDYVRNGEFAAQRALLRANQRPVLPPEDWVSPGRSGAP